MGLLLFIASPGELSATEESWGAGRCLGAWRHISEIIDQTWTSFELEMVSPHGIQVTLTNLFLSLFDWDWGPKLAYIQLGIWALLHLSALICPKTMVQMLYGSLSHVQLNDQAYRENVCAVFSSLPGFYILLKVITLARQELFFIISCCWLFILTPAMCRSFLYKLGLLNNRQILLFSFLNFNCLLAQHLFLKRNCKWNSKFHHLL